MFDNIGDKEPMDIRTIGHGHIIAQTMLTHRTFCHGSIIQLNLQPCVLFPLRKETKSAKEPEEQRSTCPPY